MTEHGPEPRSGPAVFATTHWSLVLAAGETSGEGAAAALETLCRHYWSPLYAFVRRVGHSPHEAQDLTQEFFAWLLESKHLRVADQERGRFRSFLLVRLKHFLSDQRKKAGAQKRGGGQTIIAFDSELGEAQFSRETAGELPPDLSFDRRWALTVMQRAADALQHEYTQAGRGELFEVLKQFQPGDEAGQSYEEAAGRLGISASALKSAVHRFRSRYRDLLRGAIAETVATPAEIDEEIRYLLSVVSRSS